MEMNIEERRGKRRPKKKCANMIKEDMRTVGVCVWI